MEAQCVAIDVDIVDVAGHPEDDLVIATAVAGQVDFLITGDRQLQRIGSYQGDEIVNPREFLTPLERLEQDDEIVP